MPLTKEQKEKRQGTEILISAATYEALPAERELQEIAAVPRETRVKAKKEALYLYPVQVGPAAQAQTVTTSHGGTA